MKSKTTLPIFLVGSIIAYLVITALIGSYQDGLEGVVSASMDSGGALDVDKVMELAPEMPLSLRILSFPILAIASSEAGGVFPLWGILAQSALWGLIASFLFPKK